MSIFRDFFVKEKPVFTGIARGIGGFGFGGSASAAFVAATPFTAKIVLVGGGGGDGLGQGGGGGGAGGVAFFDFPITIATSYWSRQSWQVEVEVGSQSWWIGWRIFSVDKFGGGCTC